MISLAASTVIEDAAAAPSLAHLEKAIRHLPDSSIPVDFLEGAVWPASQRGGQAVTPVLIEVDALRFLACIPLRCDMIAIAADPRDATSIEFPLDAAV